MDYFNQESERLIFRALTKKDIESWVEFFDNNNMLSYIGLDINFDPLKIAKEWIEKQLERYESDGFGHLAVIEKDSGDFIGMGGILTRELLDIKEFEIAYSLKPNYWNLGYGTEIAQKLYDFGKKNNISSSFISIIDNRNSASINVALKNNMKFDFETQFTGLNVNVYRTI